MLFRYSLEVSKCEPFVRIFCFLGLRFFRDLSSSTAQSAYDAGGCDAQRSAEAVQKGTPGTDLSLLRVYLLLPLTTLSVVAMGGCAGKTADAPKPGNKTGSSMPKKEIKEGGIGHAQFIIENTGKITDYYQLDKKKLGEGSYGSVCKATNISTKAIRAVKTISKSQMKNLERFKQEIAIMKMMDHPNIIKLFENIYLVMELCSGGELFDRIIESGHFSEQQAAILMQQIIRAIYYMHENQVCHRDLKPENFLFMTKDLGEPHRALMQIFSFGFPTDAAMSSILSSAAKKRILSDLKHLQEEPIPLAAAAPCSDDISLWNGIIGTQMEVTHIGFVTVPLHFLIEFPCDYPSSAPKIGFSFEFEYRGGASYIMREGRLVGKKVICLDVLGNFDFVHTEWKQTVGSGWSPAYTVTTLLIQLQSVLSDLGDNMSQKERGGLQAIGVI
eukprot:s288_g22.t1